MNKKEVTEIKKQFTPSNCAITRICGCYVDGEKEKKTEMKDAFLSLPEEEMFKYFDIFRKSLSGTIGKNLLNMEFPLETESEGGTQEFLLKLRNSRLTDDALLEEFYNRVIDSYDYAENYLILLMHDGYDVPYRSQDGNRVQEMDTEVFHYILCSICPVKMTKPALAYDAGENLFHSKEADWVVGMPELGFMFPCFDQRAANIYNVLYYTRDTAQSHAELIDALFHSPVPMPAAAQKEAFQAILQDTLGEECSYEVMQTVHEQVLEKIEEQKADKSAEQPPQITRQDMDAVLADCGVTEEKRAAFDEKYDAEFGQAAAISAASVSSPKQFELRTPDVVIKVSPDRSDLVETRMIDGHPYILIRAEAGVEVNGVNVTI